ncbi:MAG: SpoVG family protein [Planctomycetota bacterium]
MDITEIRVKLVDQSQERLRAFCTVTMNREFVIRDVKVIEGPRGPFVAMPSRKVMDRCPNCGGKNHLRANHCNDCGRGLPADRAPRDDRGRARLHVDVAHPINQDCRSFMEQRILGAYHAELVRSQQPGYVAPDLADDDDYIFDHDAFLPPPPVVVDRGPMRARPEQQDGRTFQA